MSQPFFARTFSATRDDNLKRYLLAEKSKKVSFKCARIIAQKRPIFCRNPPRHQALPDSQIPLGHVLLCRFLVKWPAWSRSLEAKMNRVVMNESFEDVNNLLREKKIRAHILLPGIVTKNMTIDFFENIPGENPIACSWWIEPSPWLSQVLSENGRR